MDILPSDPSCEVSARFVNFGMARRSEDLLALLFLAVSLPVRFDAVI